MYSRSARRGAADCGEYRQAAGAFAEAVIRSVELIVQPDAKDVVGEMAMRGDLAVLLCSHLAAAPAVKLEAEENWGR